MLQLNEQNVSKGLRKVRRSGTGGGDRCDWVAVAVDEGIGSILDIGCGYGWTIARLVGKVPDLVGIDLDEEALASARGNYPGIRFVKQTGASLPFESESFDAVIFSDVIEHVGDENKGLVVDEAWRVLKPGGQFIFTAPYAGLFAWADPMDIKRRFPGIYRLYMRWTSYTPHTEMEIGHKHVSMPEIQALFAGRFTMEEIHYSGFFMPLFAWILSIDDRLHVMPRRWHDQLARFQGWESGVPYGPILSYNIRIVARKK
ncbi:MAG: class I SAM-dependent methyltransferase [Verrucomicrobiota bacterium]